MRLTAAPADLSLPVLEAARLPVDALRAWCATYHTAAARAAHRAATPPPVPGPGLFDI